MNEDNRMVVVYTARQMGKTKRLIEMCAKNPGTYIVCHSTQEADRVHEYSREMGLKIPLPITYQEVKDQMARGMKGLYIDNLELFIQFITGGIDVYGASMRKENVKIEG